LVSQQVIFLGGCLDPVKEGERDGEREISAMAFANVIIEKYLN